jgi:hypothetical protein
MHWPVAGTFKLISKRTGFDRALEFEYLDSGCRLAYNM